MQSISKSTAETVEFLATLVSRQAEGHLGLSAFAPPVLDRQAVEDALTECLQCFGQISNKYYRDDEGVPHLRPMHAGQYMNFLYRLSRKEVGILWKEAAYGLTRSLFAADLFHEVHLPDNWYADHPLGSVVGRAKYADYFEFMQGVTVGQSGGVFPSFSGPTIMMSDSKVLGDSQLGPFVVLGANAVVINERVPGMHLVIGGPKTRQLIPINLQRYAGMSSFDSRCFEN